MIGTLLAFFVSPLGRIAAAALGVVVFLSAFAFEQRSKGAAKAVAKIEERNHENATKADRARRSADSLSDDRLRDPYFRD